MSDATLNNSESKWETKFKRTFAIPLLCLFCILPIDRSSATEFFRAQGDHSLNSLFGIPTPVPPNLSRDHSQLLISGTYANLYAGGADGNELLLLDGERAELRISWYQSLSSCLDWGVEVPLIAHSEGYFDRAIESWHDLFGLPNANREDAEPNTLSLFYQDTSGQTITLNSAATSPGDSHIQIIRPTECGLQGSFIDSLTTRVGVKLPTGDTDLLSGSGAADWYLDFTSGDLSAAKRTSIRASAGLMLLGDSDLVTNERSWAVFGSAVLGWQYSPLTELLVQLDWHSALFDSGLRELGAFTTQLAFGAGWRLARGARIDFAIQEDVSPDTAPDITMHIGYRRAL